MVTADGGGPGVYPSTSNTCAKDAVTKFLLTGARPRLRGGTGQVGGGEKLRRWSRSTSFRGGQTGRVMPNREFVDG